MNYFESLVACSELTVAGEVRRPSATPRATPVADVLEIVEWVEAGQAAGTPAMAAAVPQAVATPQLPMAGLAVPPPQPALPGASQPGQPGASPTSQPALVASVPGTMPKAIVIQEVAPPGILAPALPPVTATDRPASLGRRAIATPHPPTLTPVRAPTPQPTAAPATRLAPVSETIHELRHWLAAPPTSEPAAIAPASALPAVTAPPAPATPILPTPGRAVRPNATPDSTKDEVHISIGAVHVRLDPAPAPLPRPAPRPAPASPGLPTPRLARLYLR